MEQLLMLGTLVIATDRGGDGTVAGRHRTLTG
jgi:hypothetical protein